MPSPSNWLALSGGIIAVGGAAYAVLVWLKRRYDTVMGVFTRLSSIGSTVDNLATNHLPHIQASLDQTVNAVGELKGDVGAMAGDLKELDRKVVAVCATQEDTKSGLHTLGQAFINHLENASREQVISKANVARHEVQIDAIIQAEQVKNSALTAALATPAPKEI